MPDKQVNLAGPMMGMIGLFIGLLVLSILAWTMFVDDSITTTALYYINQMATSGYLTAGLGTGMTDLVAILISVVVLMLILAFVEVSTGGVSKVVRKLIPK